ncbi:MAG TPA: MTH938/NDUFAF3 family protein [Castellaniella sp.]|nr:MTH938/NDUFAF3 family protein [Castellaniella sp.]
MLLQKDSNPALNTITAYGDDYLEVNRVRFRTAVSFTPDGPIRSLELQSSDDIDAALLRRLVGLKDSHAGALAFLDDTPPALPPDAPEVVLIGTGAKQVFLPAAVTSVLLSLGIGVETMTTQAAARTYNILMSEERRVLAVLIPGEPQA